MAEPEFPGEAPSPGGQLLPQIEPQSEHGQSPAVAHPVPGLDTNPLGDDGSDPYEEYYRNLEEEPAVIYKDGEIYDQP